MEELTRLIEDTWDESNPTRKRAIQALEATWEEGYEEGIKACQEEHI